MMNMARRRLLPPLLSILLAFAATTAPLASAFGAGALSLLLGAPTTRHRDRDPSHAATSRGVGGSGAAVAAAAPAPTGGVRAAFTRRDVLRRGAATGCLLGSIAAGTAAIAPADADVLRSPGRCANGEGGGCDALSDGNEYIKSLQSKSRENREANQREALNAYYMKNYPDVFAVSDRKMVRRAKDGSYALYTPEEVKELTNGGKIKLEYPMSKGGRIADLTQRPVLVLVEE